MKTLKSREFVQIRNTANVVAKSLKEKETLIKKYNAIQEQLEEVNKEINYQDEFVFNKYGVHIEEVIKRVVTKTVSPEGKEFLKGELKPADNVKWNEEAKVYEVYTEEDFKAPTIEEMNNNTVIE